MSESSQPWLGFLAQERASKLARADVLSSGHVRMHMIEDGVTHDVTQRELERLRENIAAIEKILRDAGCTWGE